MPAFVGEIDIVNEVRVAPSEVFRDGAVLPDGDLTIAVRQFFFDIAGTKGKFLGAVGVAVTDNLENFVFLDDSQTLVVNTSGYPAGRHIRLARVFASGGVIVRVTLERAFFTAADLASDLSDTTPEDVAATGSAGTSGEVSRADHAHAHGSQAGGTLHADATVSVSGFMNGADKTKIDSVETAADVTDFANVSSALGAATTSIDVNNQAITGLASPTNATDAATRGFVESVAQGLDVKDSVRAATTADITLSGLQTIDGISVADGDRVLVKNQSTAEDNGIYVASTGAWSRSVDADTSSKVTSGLFTFVEEGTLAENSGFVLSTNDPITLGTTPLAFVQFSGAGQIIAGDGLTKAGNTLDVVANVDGSIVINANDVQIGILATDAQHGSRSGGSLHATATTSVDGFLSGADKTKLDGVSAGATNTPLTTTAPADVTKSAASAGVSTDAARQDHKHDVSTATASGLVPGGASAEGSATSLARSDHTHALPAFGTVAGTFAQGNDSRLPTQDENDALVGTGTPSTSDPFVSDSDSRNSDSRTPTGAAGGDLSGTYPSPAVAALTASGPTQLTIGTITDGEVLIRSGSTITSAPSAAGIPNFQATATGDQIIVGVALTAISGMTLTPGVGTYLVQFSSSGVGGGNNDTFIYSIFVGGVQVPASERIVETNDEKSMVTHAIVTGVGVADAITIEGQAVGSWTIHQRVLTLIKLN